MCSSETTFLKFRSFGYHFPNCLLEYLTKYVILNQYIKSQGISQIMTAGLEKLTNANRSVSTVNDQLFPPEPTEIADW